MSQSFRRTLIWTIIAILLLLGAMLQLKAAPVVTAPDAVAKPEDLASHCPGLPYVGFDLPSSAGRDCVRADDRSTPG